MNSFDVGSQINLQEVCNGINQEVIRNLRESNLGINLQSTNYRTN